MGPIEQQLMICLAAYRQGSPSADCMPDFTPSDWKELRKLASVHKLVPVVYDTLRRNPAFCADCEDLKTLWRRETLMQGTAQALRSRRIVEISTLLRAQGIPHALVKGLLCRELFSRPDLRISGDEDLFIRQSDKERCHGLLAQNGLEFVREDEDVAHWQDASAGLHIELHTKLFSSRRKEDAWLNRVFEAQLDKTITVQVSGGQVDSFHPTYHFVFLVCHALKHFLTGGFGVRTLCDIVSFAEKYRQEIDVSTADRLLREVHGRIFLDQLFSVGESHLGFDPAACGWHYSKTPDAAELLEDCLDAGVYGQSSLSRKHSAGLVLQAVEQETKKTSILANVFPSVEKMAGKYPVLKRAPVLLPLCWAHRVGKYVPEVLRSKKGENSPIESVMLGKKRTEMMVKYGVLQQSKKKN